MAIFSSHTLNGTDGTHAGDIGLTLTNLNTGEVVFKGQMDDGGRLTQKINDDEIDTKATYELVFDTAAYWNSRNITATITQIAIRFKMPNSAGAYHIPIILNPNSYSMWCSA